MILTVVSVGVTALIETRAGHVNMCVHSTYSTYRTLSRDSLFPLCVVALKLLE